MLKRFATLLIALFAAVNFYASLAGAASVCAPLVGSCEYYSCTNDSLRCSSDQYFVKLGQHYCDKFSANLDQLSEKGRAFVNSMRLCLQEQMELTAPVLSCGNAKVHANKHHVDCYEKNGFCNLSALDKIKISVIASPAIFMDPLMKQASSEIRHYCAAQNR